MGVVTPDVVMVVVWEVESDVVALDVPVVDFDVVIVVVWEEVIVVVGFSDTTSLNKWMVRKWTCIASYYTRVALSLSRHVHVRRTE